MFLPVEIPDDMLILKKNCIKFAPKCKDIDRQYEMNNNCELDNGVYNKFVRESSHSKSSSVSSSGSPCGGPL